MKRILTTVGFVLIGTFTCYGLEIPAELRQTADHFEEISTNLAMKGTVVSQNFDKAWLDEQRAAYKMENADRVFNTLSKISETKSGGRYSSRCESYINVSRVDPTSSRSLPQEFVEADEALFYWVRQERTLRQLKIGPISKLNSERIVRQTPFRLYFSVSGSKSLSEVLNTIPPSAKIERVDKGETYIYRVYVKPLLGAEFSLYDFVFSANEQRLTGVRVYMAHPDNSSVSQLSRELVYSYDPNVSDIFPAILTRQDYHRNSAGEFFVGHSATLTLSEITPSPDPITTSAGFPSDIVKPTDTVQDLRDGSLRRLSELGR